MAGARGADLEVAYAWGVVRQLFEPRLRGMSAAARGRTLGGAAALAGPVVLPEPLRSAGRRTRRSACSTGCTGSSPRSRRGARSCSSSTTCSGPTPPRSGSWSSSRTASTRCRCCCWRRSDRPPRPSTARSAGRRSRRRWSLPPLSLEATAAVLAERDGARSPPRSSAACHDATGGNPLLVRRLADGLRERGVDDAGRRIAA